MIKLPMQKSDVGDMLSSKHKEEKANEMGDPDAPKNVHFQKSSKVKHDCLLSNSLDSESRGIS